jgi:hypothetical protein
MAQREIDDGFAFVPGAESVAARVEIAVNILVHDTLIVPDVEVPHGVEER